MRRFQSIKNTEMTDSGRASLLHDKAGWLCGWKVLHLTLSGVRVLMIRINSFDDFSSPSALCIFYNFTQVEILDRHVVITITVRAANRIEICRFHCLADAILIVQVT